MPKGKVLVVDDDKLICWSLEKALKSEGYDVGCAFGGKEALERISSEQPDIMLLDLMLPDLPGVEVLEHLNKNHMQLPVLVITAHAAVDSAVRAMKLGAHDYICKPFNIEEVKLAVRKALEVANLRQEVDYRRSRERRSYSFDNIIGSHPAMQEVLRLARKVAASDASTVLIQGESGTGKDLLARAIHYESARARYPLVEVSCTAVPETLLESELFGHERGAFTDAKTQKRGLFEIADGGTVLLEEVGDMTQPMQAKLLKVLEDWRFRRVGGVKDIHVDVRVVATTNRDLAAAVEEGSFRLDLFYRLQVVPIVLPPLRERREDILMLTRHFMKVFNRQFRRNMTKISKEAQELLLRYDWPGNIRQLKNVVERAMILDDAEELLPEHLPAEIHAGPTRTALEPHWMKLPPDGVSLEEVERDLVVQALTSTGGNQVQAARLLGIGRDALRHRMKKFGLL
jgi:DNA-binding NtrC family response regulator